MPSLRKPLPILLGLALLASSGCGTRYQRVPIQENGDVTALLRAELRSGQRFDRGFHQPVTISGVRLAHVLSELDVRVDDDDKKVQRRPAIPTDLIYPLRDLLSKALAQADSSQEVVVQALRHERRLALFTQTYATSLTAYVGKDERLYLVLSRLDWPVPKGKEDELHEPMPGKEVMAFRVLASEGIDPVAHQTVAVSWQDERFRNPSAVHVGPGGKVTRRTVLMESDAPPAEEPTGNKVEAPSDAATLRALADLEDARRSGAITEADYQRKRRELLEGAAGP